MNGPGFYLEYLIEGCRNGNEKAMEKLYEHYYGYAYSVSRLNTYSDDEAFEVMNDSFLKVFSSIHKFNQDYPFKPWFRKIIINTSIDYFRKNNRHRYILDVEEMEIPIENCDALDTLSMEEILNLLDELPPVQRMVFNLYEIQGYSHKEISIKLNIKESSSRTFLTRAKRKLQIRYNANFKYYEREI